MCASESGKHIQGSRRILKYLFSMQTKFRFIIPRLSHLGIHIGMINVNPSWFCPSCVDFKAGPLLKTLCCQLPSLMVFRHHLCHNWYHQWTELGEKAAEKRQLLWQIYLNLSKSSRKETGTSRWIRYWTGSSCRAGSSSVLCSSICPLHIIGSQLINQL